MILAKERAIVREADLIEEIAIKGYGEKEKNQLVLGPEEALYLKDKKPEIEIQDEKGKKLKFEELMKHFTKIDKEFPCKYLVYKDLRDRGFCVRTGFKYGSHFRVYARGDKPGQGHAVWLVHCLPEEYVCDFSDVSRAVRLAQNVRKKMIYALYDKEGDITYYKFERITP